MNWTIAKIEIKRIQSYLFAVPRLKSMIGANVLLGELLRGRFDGEGFDRNSLPALAVACGACLPASIERQVERLEEAIRKSIQTDDYSLCWRNEKAIDVEQDSPAVIARKTGVLVRDAGRLHAVFPDPEKAQQFVRRAEEFVALHLPGAVTSVSYWPESIARSVDAPCLTSVLDLPQAETCEVSGTEMAARWETKGDIDQAVSSSTWKKLQAASSFQKGESADVLGLLYPELLARIRKHLGTMNCHVAEDFTQLAPSGYLAVIHADGNEVGTRIKQARSGSEADSDSLEARIDDWAQLEAMFFSLRHGMRNAVMDAVVQSLAGMEVRDGKEFTLPLQLLMLGGDDLLVACDATLALPFVVHLAESLTRYTQDAKGGALSLGIGVSITKSKFPFHRSHALAEQLAASAKRAKSIASDKNVVDWLLTSETWYGDIRQVRRENAVKNIGGETMVLSSKPYAISTALRGKSLKQMLDDAQEVTGLIHGGLVSRGQLKTMMEGIGQGRCFSDFIVSSLPSGTRSTLKRLNYVLTTDQGLSTPFRRKGEIFMTDLEDFLEVVELMRMRRLSSDTFESLLPNLGEAK